MKKSISTILAIVLALSTMTGCASKSGDTKATDPVKKEKAVITVIQNKVEIQTQLEEAAKAFNMSQSDVEVQILGSAGDNLVTTLQSQFASSPEKAPTLFTCGSGSEFDKFFKYMAPMDSAKSAAKVAKGQADDAMKDGKLYGLPLAIEGFGLIYNKAMFKEAGVDPASIKSVDDLVAASKKLAQIKGVKNPIAFAKETYFQFMHPFNWPFATMSNYKEVIPKVISGELKLKDIPEVKQYAEDLSKLKPYTNLAKDSYDDQVAGFAQGKFAMIHQGNWAQGIIDDYKVGFEYGMMPMPINGNESLSVGNTNFFHVNNAATAAQQAGAIKFLDWLFTQPAGQTFVTDKFKVIPAYNDFDTSKLNTLSKEISTYSEKGKTIPWTFNLFPAGVDKDCSSAMEKFYAGKTNSDGLLDEINAVWVNAAKK
ncbi:ABC transporter substrate-binding protein [Clostridium estertheticum]|uniref:ABC transporter substrate-binding protein n=1 Tax=Clostridium estertheticum TaxID=238834 RepID=UPI0013E90F03|nr:ABC transporter substrate-binding protein [Clostridium estertheticum]MBZ9688600.1 ABC transporter substrate-binding protein [Clostridium estertheticum]